MKPVLYLDVDGVPYGCYDDSGGCQMRPGVRSFLLFCLCNFQVKWLTACSAEHMECVLKAQYMNRWMDRFEYVNHPYGKAAAIDTGSDFYWVEDGCNETDMGVLRQAGVEDRFIATSYYGSDELYWIQTVLSQRLTERGISKISLDNL